MINTLRSSSKYLAKLTGVTQSAKTNAVNYIPNETLETHTHSGGGRQRGTVALACGELRINKLKAVRTRQKWRKYADLEGMEKSSQDENYVGKKHKKEQKEKIREAEVQ